MRNTQPTLSHGMLLGATLLCAACANPAPSAENNTGTVILRHRSRPRRATRLSCVAGLSIALALGCTPTSNTELAQVEYRSTPPMGAWTGVPGGPSGGGAGTLAQTAGVGGNELLPIAGTGSAGMMAAATGGSGAAGSGVAGSGAAGSGAAGTGAAGTGVAGSGAAGTGGGTSMTLGFSVLTQAQGGGYRPKNVGAIWIENNSGQFVKTLAVWAARRANHLTKWNGEAAANRVDAISSATLSSHQTHSVTWNLKDVSGQVVPDGAYKVIVECTDKNSGSGAFASIDFSVGATPVSLSPPDQTYFKGMQLKLQ